MNAVEAAHRLGVHETMVTEVREHSGGHIVSLRDGRQILVSETVARAYVPEVDDETTVDVRVAEPVVKPKRAAPKGRAGGSAA